MIADNQQPDESISNLMRCPKCHLAFECAPDETAESLAAECGVGHHADTEDGCPGFPTEHVHHYVLKGSGGSHYAECDVVLGHFSYNGGMFCGEKLAGDNGPIVGSRAKVLAAIEDAE